ncbi:peptidoglycan recognition protein-like [Gigantopelta aegis]|uniref:peptidoglycan recognition protein-like n=1 Tax=Gigantopelta aegis TaxID=1735272 RepID=UPI001B88DD55|nr:peptidoglycan recognition protein-like [Gigantopelta aegis]
MHLLSHKGDEKCAKLGGVCVDDSISYCSGSYVSHACSGGAHHRCCLAKHTLVDIGDCSDFNVTIVSRDSWGARRPTVIETIHLPVPWVFIHHGGHECQSLDTCASSALGIQKYHMNSRKYWDIAYSFLVGGDGRVYEARGWHHRGGHTHGYNTKSIAVCVLGNYMERLPSRSTLDVIHRLLACAAARGKISHNYRLYGHRDVRATACPGTQLYNEIKTWTHYSTVKPG